MTEKVESFEVVKKDVMPVSVTKKVGVWRFRSGKEVPLTELTDKQLQKSKLTAQAKELSLWNREQQMARLAEELDEEAERRGIVLSDYNREFFHNSHKHREEKRIAKEA